MSLATRCPACQTVFRVVQDQLRVSEGWVRCGRCAEVFNALEHMVEVVRPPPPSPVPVPVPVAAAPLAPPEVPAGTPDLSDPEARHDARVGSAAASAPAVTMQESELYDPLRHGGLSAGRDDPVAVVAADAGVDPVMDAGMTAEDVPATPGRPDILAGMAAVADDALPVADDAEEGWLQQGAARAALAPQPAAAGSASTEALLDVRPGWRDEPAAGDDWAARASPGAVDATQAPGAAAPVTAGAAEPVLPGAAPAAMAADAAPAALPSFVRQAERAARWQRPGVRRLLLALVLLGMVGLGLQVLVTYRDIAAARWPLARLALEPLCRTLGCRIEAPRWLDAVVVDSTGLSLIEGTGTYRLQVVLRNRSTLALAPPSLDVSLKDAQGRLLVRRQLALRELGSPVAVLPAASDVTLQATLALSGVAAEKTAVSSYTIEVFYP